SSSLTALKYDFRSRFSSWPTYVSRSSTLVTEEIDCCGRSPFIPGTNIRYAWDATSRFSAAGSDNLNKHFGGSPLTQIPNKVAFHYADDDNLTEQSFQAVGDTEPLELYLTKQVGNSFYDASELIVMSTAIRMAMPGGDAEAAFSELYDIVIEVSRNITDL